MRIRQLAIILAIPILLVGLASCGGDDSDSDDTTGSGAAGGGEATGSDDQALEFVQCLREQGLDVPDPDPESGMIDLGSAVEDAGQEAVQAAVEACRDLAPGSEGGDAGSSQEQQEALLEFAQCMRDNGVDMADPDQSGGGVIFNDPNLANDPDFQDALTTCQPIIRDAFGDQGGVNIGGGNG